VRPGGNHCQWVQCTQISPTAIRTVIRTQARTYPHGQVYYIDTAADLNLNASRDREVPLDLDAWREALRRPEVAADLARVGVATPEDLLRYYRGRLDRIAAGVGDGPVNTDDNGWLEHRAPFDLLAAQSSESLVEWDESTAGDLARSLRVETGDAAALLADAAARAEAADDARAAAGLRRAREILIARGGAPGAESAPPQKMVPLLPPRAFPSDAP
jgi:hypothetical protein